MKEGENYTIFEANGGLVRVNVEEDALVSDFGLGNYANKTADIWIGRPHFRSRFLEICCRYTEIIYVSFSLSISLEKNGEISERDRPECVFLCRRDKFSFLFFFFLWEVRKWIDKNWKLHLLFFIIYLFSCRVSCLTGTLLNCTRVWQSVTERGKKIYIYIIKFLWVLL